MTPDKRLETEKTADSKSEVRPSAGKLENKIADEKDDELHESWKSAAEKIEELLQE